MPASANCPKNPSDVRADVDIRAPISQQPLMNPFHWNIVLPSSSSVEYLTLNWVKTVNTQSTIGLFAEHSIGD